MPGGGMPPPYRIQYEFDDIGGNSPVLSLFLFLRIQRVHDNLCVGIGDDGLVGVVDHHAGLAVGDLFHLLDGCYIYGDVLTAGGFGIVCRQLGGLGDGVAWHQMSSFLARRKVSSSFWRLLRPT